MKTYYVTIPIAGHAYVEIEAESLEDACNKALELDEWTDIELDTVSDFKKDGLPQPWKIEAEEMEEDKDEEN